MAIENNPKHHEFLAGLKNQGFSKDQITAAAKQLQGGSSLRDVQSAMGVEAPQTSPLFQGSAATMSREALEAAVHAKIKGLPKDQMPKSAEGLSKLYAETAEAVQKEAVTKAAGVASEARKAAATSPEAMTAFNESIKPQPGKPTPELHTTITTGPDGKPVTGHNQVVYKDEAGKVVKSTSVDQAVKAGDVNLAVGKDGAVTAAAPVAQAAAQQAADKVGLGTKIMSLFRGDNKMSGANMAVFGAGAAGAAVSGSKIIRKDPETGKRRISFTNTVVFLGSVAGMAAAVSGHKEQGNAIEGGKAIVGKFTDMVTNRGNSNGQARGA